MDTTTIIMTAFILLLIVALFGAVSFGSKKLDKTKRDDILKKLQELEVSVQSLDSAIRRDSVIKLDNLLAKSLQYYFNNSNTCGDNLKKSGKIFKKKELDDLWEVHKIRNLVVHDDYEVKEEEALNIYSTYKFSIKKILK